jgi:hemolysin activation/secretion protein
VLITRTSLGKRLCLLAAILTLAGTVRAAEQPADKTSAGAAPATPAQAPAPLPRFDVHEYRVLGNSVLSNRDIEEVLYPLLGEHKSIEDVQVARAALEKAYHDRGFATVFVDIPEQELKDQIVRLKVTESRLNSVRIAGARYFSEGKILAAIPAATPGEVPNLTALQKQLNAVNVQTADRAVIPILKAGPVPGTVDLALNVNDHLPVHGSLEVNNQNTPQTRVLRLIASLSYSNLFQSFDSLSAQYQAAPQDVSQVNVLAINYAWGASADQWHPSVYFINSNSNVPTVGTIGVLGAGQIFGTRFTYPLVDTLAPAHMLTFGIDYKHFRETIGLEGNPAVITPISYVNLSAGYSGYWSSSDWWQESLGATVNFGPRGVPNNPQTFANKRYRGRPNYAYLKLDSSWMAHLPKGFELLLRANGQFAPQPLITNEDYSISGADGVRGYLEAEALADTGYKASVQLQSPVMPWGKKQLGDLFVFFDAGRTDSVDPLPGEPATTELRSWGAGLHVLPGQPINGLLTWADPLSHGPITHRGDWRVLFVIRGSF